MFLVIGSFRDEIVRPRFSDAFWMLYLGLDPSCLVLAAGSFSWTIACFICAGTLQVKLIRSHKCCVFLSFAEILIYNDMGSTVILGLRSLNLFKGCSVLVAR